MVVASLLPEPNGSFNDPLAGDLGQVRISENLAALIRGSQLLHSLVKEVASAQVIAPGQMQSVG
jgi:hypothetical protein